MQAFIKPMWKASEVPIPKAFELIWQKHIKQLFGYVLFYIACVSFLITLFAIKKEARWVSLFSISMFFVLGVNMLFFFHQFYHHEYYLLVFFPFAISSIVLAFYWLNHSQFKFKTPLTIISLFCLIMIVNMNMHQTNRYLDKLKNHYPYDDYFQSYYGVDNLLSQYGIDPNARIWCWADNSTSITLYLIGHRGLTQYYYADGSLAACKKQQIQYLLINSSTDKDQGEIQYLKNQLVFAEKGFELYKIYYAITFSNPILLLPLSKIV